MTSAIKETILKRPDLEKCRAHLKKMVARYGGIYTRVETRKAEETVRCLDYIEAMETEFAIRNQMLDIAADILEGAALPHLETEEGEPTYTVHPREVWLKGLKRQAMMDLGLITKGENANGHVSEVQGKSAETGEEV